MNAHELYKQILKACAFFGIPFYEMELMTVQFEFDAVVFEYQGKKIIVNKTED